MTEPLLDVRAVSKSFGAVKASTDINLDLREGEIHALIGPNGAGKSTLIKQIAGGLRPDSGAVFLTGRISRGCRLQRARGWEWDGPFRFHRWLWITRCFRMSCWVHWADGGISFGFFARS